MNIRTSYGEDAFVFISSGFELTDDNVSLLKVFATNIFACFNNINLIRRLDDYAFRDITTGLPNINAIRNKIDEHIQKLQPNVSLCLVHIQGLGKLYSMFNQEKFNEVFMGAYKYLEQHFKHATMIGRMSLSDFAVVSEKEEGYSEQKALPNIITYSQDNEQSITLTTTNAIIKPKKSEKLSADEIIQRASVTLIHAKEVSRGQTVEYTEELTESVSESIHLQYQLRQSFSQDLPFIKVFLQPKFNASTDEIIGAEALSRWSVDTMSISPNVFIPVIEQSGFSDKLIDLIIREIGIWNRNRVKDKLPLLPVSVNLSMNDLKIPGYAERLIEKTEKYDVKPEMLEFEITEGVLMSNKDQTIKELRNIKESGFRIAIDDFGTGFSSLSYLEYLPIDILKIDKTFVDRIDSKHAKHSIAFMIINLAESLNLEVIAEGVETFEQVQILQFMGCEIFQGYYFGKPVNIYDFCRTYSQEPDS